ncbi:probable bifunctional dTTP/UTP pyrophosphatase/methyltransferase protein isoform X4 [Ostrea edulis]|uniref:probable bifunctional dTTP/UTP pyrophosphatase/methyltransferase protein isoform X4 n=1 Tax=Ostrea edulis TaxID=37623 RepID=UPI0020955AC4|nr:probable bifunctional dTTP/UTP pyrophosphatase/methyltransferase protein isoform X4 [Ostrea edulis]
MLEPILQQLNSKRIVLASSSPRRRQILGNINLKFETAKSNFEENLDKGTFSCPLDYVRETAKQKTLEVVDRLFSLEPSPDLIIGADTIVTNGKSIFEKPSSKDHAIEMITRLNKMACCDLDYFYLLLGYAAKNSFCGRSHKVLTSVVLVTPKSSDNLMAGCKIALYQPLDMAAHLSFLRSWIHISVYYVFRSPESLR